MVKPGVFDCIGKNLDLIAEPSIRHSVIASHSMRLGIDWRRDLLSNWSNLDPKRLVRKLSADTSRESDRIDRVHDLTGFSRTRYFEIMESLGLKGNCQRRWFSTQRRPKTRT